MKNIYKGKTLNNFTNSSKRQVTIKNKSQIKYHMDIKLIHRRVPVENLICILYYIIIFSYSSPVTNSHIFQTDMHAGRISLVLYFFFRDIPRFPRELYNATPWVTLWNITVICFTENNHQYLAGGNNTKKREIFGYTNLFYQYILSLMVHFCISWKIARDI